MQRPSKETTIVVGTALVSTAISGLLVNEYYISPARQKIDMSGMQLLFSSPRGEIDVHFNPEKGGSFIVSNGPDTFIDVPKTCSDTFSDPKTQAECTDALWSLGKNGWTQALSPAGGTDLALKLDPATGRVELGETTMSQDEMHRLFAQNLATVDRLTAREFTNGLTTFSEIIVVLLTVGAVAQIISRIAKHRANKIIPTGIGDTHISEQKSKTNQKTETVPSAPQKKKSDDTTERLPILPAEVASHIIYQEFGGAANDQKMKDEEDALNNRIAIDKRIMNAQYEKRRTRAEEAIKRQDNKSRKRIEERLAAEKLASQVKNAEPPMPLSQAIRFLIDFTKEEKILMEKRKK